MVSCFANDIIKEFLQKCSEISLNQTIQHKWDKIMIKREKINKNVLILKT